MEYLIVHRGGREQSIVYELAFDGTTNKSQTHMMGLIDVKQLYDKQKSGQKSDKSTPSLPQVCPKSGGGLDSKITTKPKHNNGFEQINGKIPKNAHLGSKKTEANHVVHQ